VAARRRKRRTPPRLIRLPEEYLEVIALGNVLFPSFYQFENGFRVLLNSYLSTLYGVDWWNLSLKTKLPRIHEYADEQKTKLGAMPWIGLPVLDGMWDISFSWSLVPVFVIASICGALKSFGNLVLCEKVNDDNWQKPDTRRIGSGLMADGVCVTISGLIGGVASDTSSSNVSLSGASGATSRVIGFAAGGLFILLGLSPKLSALLSVMPAPVAGAIIVFVVCFMMTSGLQIMLSTKPDSRKTFVLGTALCFGLSLDMLPELYAHLTPWLRPMFESSLTLSTVIAVVLNQLLRVEEHFLSGRKVPQPEPELSPH